MLAAALAVTLTLTSESVLPTRILISESISPTRRCQGIPNTGTTGGYDISKPSVATVAACIAACEALESCCIAQFNPAHERAKCDLKNYGSLRPRPADNVTAITCVPGCPLTPPPHPHPPTPVPPDRNGTVRVSPGDNIQAVVNSAPNGTTFLFAPGIYRQVSITPRPGDIFVGDSPSPQSVVLTGAKIILPSEVKPVPQDGHQGLFVAPNRTETLRNGPGKCDKFHPRCTYTSDLFFDGKPLHHVGSRAAVNCTGTWFWDFDSNSIFFFVSVGAGANGIDGHVLELSIVSTAFGESHSQRQDTPNVTIANMTVQMFANPAQSGAIGGPPGTYWTVANVVATLNHGAGVAIRDGGRILNSKLLHNGQQGYHSDRGGGLLIAENEVAFNNFAGFDQGWEAGAGKLSHDNNDGGAGPGHTHANNERTVLRNNFVHDNLGRGMWADVNDVRVSYLNNLVIRNSREGIAHEISHSATIEGNTLCFNGESDDIWLWGSQIVLQNSDNSVVYNNSVVVGSGGNGIGLIYQPRMSGNESTRTSNNTIKANYVWMLDSNTSTHGYVGGVSNCVTPPTDGDEKDPTKNPFASPCHANMMWEDTRFRGNHYFFNVTSVRSENQMRFRWATEATSPPRITFKQWMDAGNDVDGSIASLDQARVPSVCQGFAATGS